LFFLIGERHHCTGRSVLAILASPLFRVDPTENFKPQGN